MKFCKKQTIAALIAVSISTQSYSSILNGVITIGGENGKLDLSNTPKGFVLPRIALHSTDNPAPLGESMNDLKGMMIFNTADSPAGTNAVTSVIKDTLYLNNGKTWDQMVIKQSKPGEIKGIFGGSINIGVINDSQECVVYNASHKIQTNHTPGAEGEITGVVTGGLKINCLSESQSSGVSMVRVFFDEKFAGKIPAVSLSFQSDPPLFNDGDNYSKEKTPHEYGFGLWTNLAPVITHVTSNSLDVVVQNYYRTAGTTGKMNFTLNFTFTYL